MFLIPLSSSCAGALGLCGLREVVGGSGAVQERAEQYCFVGARLLQQGSYPQGLHNVPSGPAACPLRRALRQSAKPSHVRLPIARHPALKLHVNLCHNAALPACCYHLHCDPTFTAMPVCLYKLLDRDICLRAIKPSPAPLTAVLYYKGAALWTCFEAKVPVLCRGTCGLSMLRSASGMLHFQARRNACIVFCCHTHFFSLCRYTAGV